MENDKPTGRAKGGKKRAEVLSPVERSSIAAKAAAARWGKPLQATHKGNFKQEFGVDVECYVLDDPTRTAVISQRGMGRALGYSPQSAGRLPRLVGSKNLVPYIGPDLREKLQNPLIFQGLPAGPGQPQIDKIHGFDGTLLIDLCKAIIAAEADGKLIPNQARIAKQAHIIVGASAKAGMKGLIYALSGYNPTAQEVIDAFKLYVQEEAKKYEREFPNELYVEWHRLYDIPVPERGKPWHFKNLTVKHVYYPLAKSNGKLYELLRALKARDGDRQKKLFQFLNEIGARALRIQLGRILEMCESSSSKSDYEAKIVERFGGQRELDFVASPNSSSSDSEQPS